MQLKILKYFLSIVFSQQHVSWNTIFYKYFRLSKILPVAESHNAVASTVVSRDSST